LIVKMSLAHETTTALFQPGKLHRIGGYRRRSPSPSRFISIAGDDFDGLSMSCIINISHTASQTAAELSAGRAAGIDKRISLQDAAQDAEALLFPLVSPLYVSLSLSLWSWAFPRTVHMSVSISQQIHISSPLPLASPALLFPEARLRPSLLGWSLTTGCEAIARVGSLDHIAVPSAMRRFSRTHPRSIGGDRGNRVPIAPVWIPSTKKTDAGAKGFQCLDEEGRWLCDFFCARRL
jgi:hypothetical protein